MSRIAAARVKDQRKGDRHADGYMREYMRVWMRKARAEKKKLKSSSQPVDTSV